MTELLSDKGREAKDKRWLVLQGFHSQPKPYNHANGFEIKMWNLNGTITTPWFGGDYMEEYYKAGIDERPKSPIEKRKRNMKFFSPIWRREREL